MQVTVPEANEVSQELGWKICESSIWLAVHNGWALTSVAISVDASYFDGRQPVRLYVRDKHSLMGS